MFIWDPSLLLRTLTHAIKWNHGNKTFLLLFFSNAYNFLSIWNLGLFYIFKKGDEGVGMIFDFKDVTGSITWKFDFNWTEKIQSTHLHVFYFQYHTVITPTNVIKYIFFKNVFLTKFYDWTLSKTKSKVDGIFFFLRQ